MVGIRFIMGGLAGTVAACLVSLAMLTVEGAERLPEAPATLELESGTAYRIVLDGLPLTVGDGRDAILRAALIDEGAPVAGDPDRVEGAPAVLLEAGPVRGPDALPPIRLDLDLGRDYAPTYEGAPLSATGRMQATGIRWSDRPEPGGRARRVVVVTFADRDPS